MSTIITTTQDLTYVLKPRSFNDHIKDLIESTVAKYYSDIDIIGTLPYSSTGGRRRRKHMAGGGFNILGCFGIRCRNKILPEQPQPRTVRYTDISSLDPTQYSLTNQAVTLIKEVTYGADKEGDNKNKHDALVVLHRLKMHLFLDILTTSADLHSVYTEINSLITTLTNLKTLQPSYEGGVFTVNGCTFNINFFKKNENTLLTRIHPVPGNPTGAAERYFPNAFILPGQVPDARAMLSPSRETVPFPFTELPLDLQGTILDMIPKTVKIPRKLETILAEYGLPNGTPSDVSCLRNIIKEAVSQTQEVNTYVFTNTDKQYAFLDVKVTEGERHVSFYMQDDNGDIAKEYSFLYNDNNHSVAAEAAEIALNSLFDSGSETNTIFKVEVEGQNYKTYYLKNEASPAIYTELHVYVDYYNTVNITIISEDVLHPNKNTHTVPNLIYAIKEKELREVTLRVNSAMLGKKTEYGHFSVVDYIAYTMLQKSTDKNDVVRIQYDLATGMYTITVVNLGQGGGSPTCKFMGKKLRVLSKGKQTYVLITLNQARAFEKKLGIKNKDATHVFGRSRKTVENRGHTYALVPMKTLQKTKPVKS